jgi:hypothetical protein
VKAGVVGSESDARLGVSLRHQNAFYRRDWGNAIGGGEEVNGKGKMEKGKLKMANRVGVRNVFVGCGIGWARAAGGASPVPTDARIIGGNLCQAKLWLPKRRRKGIMDGDGGRAWRCRARIRGRRW